MISSWWSRRRKKSEAVLSAAALSIPYALYFISASFDWLLSYRPSCFAAGHHIQTYATVILPLLLPGLRICRAGNVLNDLTHEAQMPHDFYNCSLIESLLIAGVSGKVKLQHGFYVLLFLLLEKLICNRFHFLTFKWLSYCRKMCHFYWLEGKGAVQTVSLKLQSLVQ